MDVLKQLVHSIISSSASTDDVVSPYILLFQYECSLYQRVTAATTTTTTNKNKNEDDEDVYKLAGVATPSQCAKYQLQLYPSIMNTLFMESSTSSTNHILLLSCLGPSSFNTGSSTTKIIEIDFYSDPCGWDGQQNKINDNRIIGSIHQLSLIYETIQQAIQGYHDQKFVMIWDSITPLIQLHGISKILLLLQHLKKNSNSISLIVLPVSTSSHSSHFHIQLEDVCDAIISSSEKASSLKLYRPTSITQHLSSTDSNTRLSMRGGMSKFTQHVLSTAHPKSSFQPTNNTTNKKTTKDGSSTAPIENVSSSSNNNKSKTNRVILSHEPDDHPKKVEQQQKSSTSSLQTKNNHTPMIYMEDNDPEFDDFDEDDDIDDDLDI